MVRFAMLLSAVAVISGCSHNGNAGLEMKTAGYAFAPPAFKKFCANEPGLCRSAGNAKSVRLTSAKREELAAVNRSVNRKIVARNDRASSPYGDEWRMPTNAGDCEDYAIMKKAELIKRGWPASSLLLTVVTSAGRGHTVLTVRTSEGDLIMDNLSDRVRLWSSTSYKYFARQSQTQNGTWTRIRS